MDLANAIEHSLAERDRDRLSSVGPTLRSFVVQGESVAVLLREGVFEGWGIVSG